MLFHYKCVHSGIRPYKCEECGMTFARQDSWKGHTHSKVRSFLCSICGKTFARRNIRDTHERAHLNDRRYPCSFCGKKFMTNQQRTNHERTHTGEKVRIVHIFKIYFFRAAERARRGIKKYTQKFLKLHNVQKNSQIISGRFSDEKVSVFGQHPY